MYYGILKNGVKGINLVWKEKIENESLIYLVRVKNWDAVVLDSFFNGNHEGGSLG